MYKQVLVRFENENSKLFGVAGIIIDENSKVLCEFHLYDENGEKVTDENGLVRAIKRDWKMGKHLIIQYHNQSIHFRRDDYTLYINPLLES